MTEDEGIAAAIRIEETALNGGNAEVSAFVPFGLVVEALAQSRGALVRDLAQERQPNGRDRLGGRCACIPRN